MNNFHVLKLALAAVVFGFSPVVSAITIDFESLTPGDVTGPDVYGYSIFSTDGFDFLVKGGLGNGGGNQYAAAISSGNFHEPAASVNFSRTDNNAFALLDLDLLQCNGSGTCTIWGLINGGGSINTTDVNSLGVGDWLNLTGVEVFGSQTIHSLDVDNIVVGAAVPIPAAVWLFGSALAGLGWIRRKQTA
jgi:hypothetical protein